MSRSRAGSCAPAIAAVLLASVLAVSPMPAAEASQTGLPAPDAAVPTTDRWAGTAAPAKTIAPGVTYEAITDDVSDLYAYVLRFDPYAGASLVAVPAGVALPAASATVPMLKSVHAVAGINGDFLTYSRRSPVRAFATEGDLLQTRVKGTTDKLLGISSPGVVPHVGTTEVQIVLDDPTHLAHWPIDSWNPGGIHDSSLGSDEVAGYTSYGGKHVIPPGEACSARLTSPSARRWADAAMSGITRDYTVGKVVCAKSQMPLSGGTVFSALRSGSMAAEIQALVPGTTVSVTWSLEGWGGITGAIGGNPLILEGGQNTVDPRCHTYLCDPNARAGVGADAKGTIIMIVVDYGRGASGISLYDFAELFADLGAVNALNLDGDGSSTMYVNGKTVNRPGDPGRRVSSALAILPGPDPRLHIGPPA